MASRPREQAAVTAAILGRRAPAAAGRGEGQREHRWDHTHPWDCSVEPEVARGGSATRAPADGGDGGRRLHDGGEDEEGSGGGSELCRPSVADAAAHKQQRAREK